MKFEWPTCWNMRLSLAYQNEKNSSQPPSEFACSVQLFEVHEMKKRKYPCA